MARRAIGKKPMNKMRGIARFRFSRPGDSICKMASRPARVSPALARVAPERVYGYS
jgi:hypothetical protein